MGQEFARKRRELIQFAIGIAIFEIDVVAVDVAELLHAQLEGDNRRIDLSRNAAENRDPRALGGILPARGDRHPSHGPKQCDEVSPSHRMIPRGERALRDAHSSFLKLRQQRIIGRVTSAHGPSRDNGNHQSIATGASGPLPLAIAGE